MHRTENNRVMPAEGAWTGREAWWHQRELHSLNSLRPTQFLGIDYLMKARMVDEHDTVPESRVQCQSKTSVVVDWKEKERER